MAKEVEMQTFSRNGISEKRDSIVSFSKVCEIHIKVM